MRTSQRVWFPAMMIVGFPFDRLFVECDDVMTYIFCLSLPSPVKMANRHLTAEQGHSLTTEAEYENCINRAFNEGFRFLYSQEVGDFTHTVKYIGKDYKLAQSNVIKFCGTAVSFIDGPCKRHENIPIPEDIVLQYGRV